jgi:hypothetical protein
MIRTSLNEAAYDVAFTSGRAFPPDRASELAPDLAANIQASSP